MKKKNVNTLSLNKKAIASFEDKQLNGGIKFPTASCILCGISYGGLCHTQDPFACFTQNDDTNCQIA